MQIENVFAQAEKDEMDKLLPRMFGYHLLQVGDPKLAIFSASTLISHRIFLSSHKGEVDVTDLLGKKAWPCSLVRGKTQNWPLLEDSMDVVIMPHALEQTKHPHQMLREAHRVLRPEGEIVLVGYNPMSMWGIWHFWQKKRNNIKKSDKLIHHHRLKDWLQLLDFELTSEKTFFFRPPFLSNGAKNGIMRRLLFLERWGPRWWPFLGGAYILVAKKKVVTMTPVKPKWKKRKLWPETESVPKPTTRGI